MILGLTLSITKFKYRIRDSDPEDNNSISQQDFQNNPGLSQHSLWLMSMLQKY